MTPSTKNKKIPMKLTAKRVESSWKTTTKKKGSGIIVLKEGPLSGRTKMLAQTLRSRLLGGGISPKTSKT